MGSGTQINVEAAGSSVPTTTASKTTASTSGLEAAGTAGATGTTAGPTGQPGGLAKPGNATSRASSSSGYKSDNSIGSEAQQMAQARSGLSLVAASGGGTGGRAKKTPDKLELLSRSQPDIFTSLEEEEVAAVTGNAPITAAATSNGGSNRMGVESGHLPRAASSSTVAETIAANQIKVYKGRLADIAIYPGKCVIVFPKLL